jgi:CheY-like chemotaxis protein
MSKLLSGSPIQRPLVFILADGSFVVQWDETRVQELMSGRYRVYDDKDFGHAITDYELNQLKAAGRVEHYNRQYVWLYALPETGRFDHESKTLESHPNRVRSYYLNTTLPKTRQAEVEKVLTLMNLHNDFLVRNRGDVIAILGKNGTPFWQLKDAERAQKHLIAKAPEVFKYTAIAFIETTNNDHSYRNQLEHTPEVPDLTTLIASQTDTSVTQGKCVVLVTSHEEQRQAIHDLFVQMKMEVKMASSASEGLQLLEDWEPALLIMDLQLPDMHGWQMLAKMKEVGTFHNLPIIVIADHTSSTDNQAFALTVVKVDVFLMKPVSMAQLRQNVWMTLKSAQPTH